ncbi:MAG: ribbon-helix-helix domain-containing protein [Alphaproteobacteria bacterium]|nr:ribbon-helix-helix domain-containing protein [Alphaproteobacteria bacterium]
MLNVQSLYDGAPALKVSKTPFRSSLVSRNVVVSGRRTSVRLEPEMWDGLREICQRERATMHQICTTAELQKAEKTSLTAAIRVFVMRYFRLAATDEGHAKAGHGYSLTLGLSLNSGANYERRPVVLLTKTSFV